MKTNGQMAYEADVLKTPLYPDDTPRKTWEQLPEYARRTWEKRESEHENT